MKQQIKANVLAHVGIVVSPSDPYEGTDIACSDAYRSFRKREIEALLENAFKESPNDGSLRDLRKQLADVVGTYGIEIYADGNFDRQMRKSEIKALKRAVEETEPMEADDVYLADKVEPGDTITINGDDYAIREISRGHWSWLDVDEPPHYETFEEIRLDDDKYRLMILRGMTDRCRYDHSVILEEHTGYWPLNKYEKVDYVYTIEL